MSLTKSAALTGLKYGVNANIIAPVAKTRMSDAVPFGLEMGEPEDIARAALFLCSDEAKLINGAVLSVDDGMSAC